LSHDNTTHYSHLAYMSAEWSVSLSVSDFMLTNTKAYDTPEGFLAKVTCASKFFARKLAQVITCGSATWHTWKSKQKKLQVKSGVASWALLYCECRFNLTTTTTTTFVVIYKLKSHFQVSHTLWTMKLWSNCLSKVKACADV